MPANAEPRILMACRGGPHLGLGHIMRTRVVARCLAERLPVHIVGWGDAAALHALLGGRGLSFQVVSGPEALPSIQQSWQPHLVVFDTTEFPPALFAAMRERATVVSLSPIFNCLGQVDLAFHRAPCPGDRDTQGSSVIRRGLEYTVIQEGCHPIPEDVYSRNLAQQPLAVAISMGGADGSNNTLRLLSSIARLTTPLLLWVLLGEGYSHSYQALVDCVNRDARHEIILAKTTDSLWRVLQSCSLAILAGGITTYEAVYAGLPSINILLHDHAAELVDPLVERGVCLSAGYPFAAALPVVNAELSSLEASRPRLLAMHRQSRALIDGRGASRIAEEIEAFHWDNGRRSILPGRFAALAPEGNSRGIVRKESA